MKQEIEKLIEKYTGKIRALETEKNIIPILETCKGCKRAVYKSIISDLQKLLTKIKATNEQTNRQ